MYVQETPDLVNSIALRVDVVLSRPDADPVLDVFSPTAWEFFVSVARSKFLSFKCLWFTVKDVLRKKTINLSNYDNYGRNGQI